MPDGARTPARRAALTLAAVAALLAAQGVLLATPASAATLTVTSTADVATNFGACGNAGQTTSSGSLREAVCAANNAGAAASTINVAAGTYLLTNGELQMGKVSGSSITLTGAGAGSTVISGNNSSRVFDLDPSVVGGVTTAISGVTITAGAVTTFGGAGIIAGSGTATTRDTLTISNSTISNNHVSSTTTNRYGGGVEFQGGSLTVTNTTFSGNSSGSSSGSALEYQHFDVASGEQLTVTGSTFSGNGANASVANINVGGALHVSGVSATTPMSVSNSTFTGNTVTGSGTGIPQGGAIFSEGGTLTVTESTFTSNSVAGGSNPQGGAISVLGGTTALHYDRITGNTGATGSGVSLGVGSGAALNATDNWWGCNTGPGTAGCDAVAGGPPVSPRLVLTATASPATVVGPNATSAITAAMTQDSLGNAIAAANLDAFAGLPVGFSDPLPSGATLTSASANLSAGSASTSYNSQSTTGPGHVLATLDNGTATATVTVNRSPAITSANTATLTTGTAASFTVTTTGYPASAITKTGTVPAGMTFTDNGNGTATLAGTPTAGGSYPLSLTANNGVNPNAVQTLTVTVRQPPTFTSASSTTFTVGTAGSFTITTSPGTNPTAGITRSGTLPNGLSLSDNGNGTATLSGTPAAGTGGVYPLNLTAANGITPNGTQTLTLTVNQAPSVTTNPASQSVNAGSSVSFIAAASGFPAPTVQWQRSTDSGASFTNIAGATSTTYTFTAAAADHGNQYRAVFTNSTGSATTSAATLTVSDAPTFSSASTTTFAVGSAGTFTVTTSGLPNPSLSTSGSVPAWLSFTDNGNGTATLAGTPPAGSGGQYGFTLHADNGVTPAAGQAFTLTVDESPTITSADHATFTAGTAGSFTVTTSAGFPVATTVGKTGALPSGVTFTDNGDGTATLAGTPAAGTGGSYPLTITATNGASTPATQSFTLTVDASPTITSADHATFTTGTPGSFTVTTSGGAGSVTVSSAGTLPAGVSLSDNGDGTATLAGTPAAGTGGSYAITITASDGVTADATQLFTLSVQQPAVITSADHATFTRGVAGSFTVTTAPGVPAATTITESGSLPAGVSFTDNGNGTATLAGTPTGSGSFPITITASNGVAPDATQSFTLTVVQAPDVTSADHATFTVGSAGSFTVTTSPAASSLTVSGAALPSGVTFSDNANGTATLAGTPAAGTGGAYSLSLKATNAIGFTTQTFTLTVRELAGFTSADHTTFTIGAAGSFTVTTLAGFPTATTITETGSLPSGVSFTDNGDGSATLAGTPAAGTAGSYPLTLSASNTTGTRQQSFTLTVVPANAPPTITSADHATFAKGTSGSFTVTTAAGYPTATTITESGTLPAGVTFTDNGDGTATLAGSPSTSGSFALTLTASNGVTSQATQGFVLTVTAKPALTSGNHTTFQVGSAGTFTVTTTPGFPTATTMTETGSLPSGVSYTDNGDGTATLAGTAAAGTPGNYPLTLSAVNSAGTTQQSFTLTVDPANSSPSFTSADHATFAKGVAGSFFVTTTAGYPTATTISESGVLPAGVSFVDNGNGTATLAGTPTSSGVYALNLSASNGVTTAATQSFTLTVTEPPTITVPSDFSVVESPQGSGTASVPYTVTATGVPTPAPVCKIGTTVVTSPVLLAIGSHQVDCSATTPVGTDNGSFTVTVLPANHPPVPSVGGPYSVAEGGSVTLDATGTTDADSDALTYTWDVNHDGTYGDATGAHPTLTWTQLNAVGINDGPASSTTVTVRVSDGKVGGTVTSLGAALTVTNTAATGAITGSSDASTGTALALTFSATDPSPADQAAGFDDTVTWGDGTTDGPFHAGSPVVRNHTYANVGVYTVTMTATDKDGGVSTATTKTVTVAGTGLVPSAFGTGTELLIGGSSAGDSIKIGPGSSKGSLKVTLNNVVKGTFSPTGGVVVLGQDGNDTITVDPQLTVAALLYGGGGNDTISGGNGNGIQLGGDGNDTLSSGNGRDLLLGGAGADTLSGNNGDDLLVAGSTSFDLPTAANQLALVSIAREWSRTDLAYSGRTSHLTGATPGGLNASNVLTVSGTGRTVTDDTSRDVLNGGLGSDWLLLNRAGGTALDTSDASASELATDL